jgi:hypothetical protein
MISGTDAELSALMLLAAALLIMSVGLYGIASGLAWVWRQLRPPPPEA